MQWMMYEIALKEVQLATALLQPTVLRQLRQYPPQPRVTTSLNILQLHRQRIHIWCTWMIPHVTLRCWTIIHALVKSLFLHFNTSIPCSAPVERLFSSPAGALILSKKRNKLTDKRFEQLLLLKVKHHCNTYRLNQSLWQWLLITKSSTIVHLVMSFDFWIFYSLAVVHYQHFT